MKRNFIPYIYTLFFILVFQKANGQEYLLKTETSTIENNSFLNSIEFKKHHFSKESVNSEIDSINLKLTKIGFLENYVDLIQEKDSIITVFFKLGENSNSIVINYSDKELDIDFLKDLNINTSNNQINTTINQVPNILNTIVLSLEKKGYSFSQVYLRNISKTKNKINAELVIDKSDYRTIDSIVVKGYTNFPKSFLKHYLKIKPETTFNSEKLIEVSNSISTLNFVSEIKMPEILFSADSTTIYLYLQKKKYNKFDGLLGFSTNELGKLKFNGYLDLKLNNVFNKGESLSIIWKGNGEERKVFNFEVYTPFIFGSPISPKATFNIYKQDSTFLNIKAAFDASYFINSKNNIAAKFQSESSNDLSESIMGNTVSGFKNIFYGLSYTFHQPDFKNSQQNKFFFNFNTLWGSRTTNDKSIKERQEKYDICTNYLWNLNTRNSIFIQNKSGVIFSNNLFTNELYRIGGANSIRGFNEESIFSSAFSILNIEYRYKTNQSSYLYTITDYAYTENNIANSIINLYGFGIGYSVGTVTGIVNLSYVLGKQDNIPFNINNSNFHIKFIQFF